MEEDINKTIKQYLMEHMTVSLEVDTNDFMSTDCSTKTRTRVTIYIDGDPVCSDSSYN